MLRFCCILRMYADTALPSSPLSVFVTFSSSPFHSASSSVLMLSFFSTLNL